MHGLGNDFMVIDAVRQNFELASLNIAALANRNKGIGFDQLLIVESSDHNGVDFRYRIFNADGGEVQQCGNGARCFARFVHEQGLTDKNPVVVETCSGIISLEILENNQVLVDMGVPIFEGPQIPVQGELNEQNLTLSLDQDRTFTVLSMGNPHAVLTVYEHDDQEIESIGKTLQEHPAFPERVNVGFMRIDNPKEFTLRVFERGVGETQACGTGACAAAVAGILQGQLAPEVTTHLLGGDLMISWQGPGQPVLMQGDASLVYNGELSI